MTPESGFESLTAAIVAVAVGILVHVARAFWADKAATRMAIVHQAVKIAYGVTFEVSKYTDTKVDDKIAFALNVLREQLEAQGVAIKESDVVLAKGAWSAMHGQEMAAAELATKGAGLVLAAPPVVPR